MSQEDIDLAIKLDDINELRQIATNHGLVNNENRSRVWPLILNCTESSSGVKEKAKDFEATEQQVALDVNRSFNTYEVSGDKEELKKELNELILNVLKRNPDLHYYQGYHDIAQVILLVFNESASSSLNFMNKLSQFVLRDYMMPKIRPSLDQLAIIPPLLTLADPYLGKLVGEIQPFYALSSIITLFSHHVSKFDRLCRLYDYIFASINPAGSVLYLYVAMILFQKQKIRQGMDGVDIMHSVLSNIYEEPFEPDQLIKMAESLKSKYKLDKLIKKISKHSVLNNGTIEQKKLGIDEVIRLQAEQSEKMNDFDTPLLDNTKNNNAKTGITTAVVGVSIAVGVLGAALYYQDQLKRF